MTGVGVPFRAMQAALVVTTVSDGQFLRAYVDNFRTTGAIDHVQIIVIPDRKTPSPLYELCATLRRESNILCPTLSDQELFLQKLGLSHLIPYDSDNRRNVGFLLALENGCDFIVSIDDDNVCLPDSDFLAEHAVVVAGETDVLIARSSSGWFNACELLEMSRESVYPRGFPYYCRERAAVEVRPGRQIIHVNAGLWLDHPDLDAVTWLAAPAFATSFRSTSVALGPDTWAPLNTQNTAVHRDAVAAFYFIRMGYPVGGLPIDRYGDIFSGYFCQACARHLGYGIRVGTPLVRHVRNAHNPLSDLANELGGIYLTEDISRWITEVRLEGSTYGEAYLSLAEQLEDAVERIFRGAIWTEPVRAYFHQMAYLMRAWSRAVSILLGAPV